MQYRKFGKTGLDMSLLGFGCMRLPVIDGDSTKIDEENALNMVRTAIDQGVNYIDTAYPYHSKDRYTGGESELFVARALKDGYREKVRIATKLPVWLCETKEDMYFYLEDQLKRLETESIDFYLLHALNYSSWSKMRDLGVCDFLDEAIEKGKIQYAGFSYHGDMDSFNEIVDAYNWAFCQIQYNYLDENYQAGKKGLEYAASKGLGVVIMEPLRGGHLSGDMPQEITDKLDSAPVKRTPAQWALRWVMDHEEVSVILSGMSEMDHVLDNLKTAGEGVANSLTREENEVVNFMKDTFKSRMKINCTECRYCMPCPVGVDIPHVFDIYNNAYLFDKVDLYKYRYGIFIPDEAKASRCIECGKCETHCPQNIEIRAELKKVAHLFETEN